MHADGHPHSCMHASLCTARWQPLLIPHRPPDPLVDLTMRVLPADICRRGRSWSPRRAPLASCAPTMPSTAWQPAASNPCPPSYCFYCSAVFVNYFKALSFSILLPFSIVPTTPLHPDTSHFLCMYLCKLAVPLHHLVYPRNHVRAAYLIVYYVLSFIWRRQPGAEQDSA